MPEISEKKLILALDIAYNNGAKSIIKIVKSAVSIEDMKNDLMILDKFIDTDTLDKTERIRRLES